MPTKSSVDKIELALAPFQGMLAIYWSIEGEMDGPMFGKVYFQASLLVPMCNIEGGKMFGKCLIPGEDGEIYASET